MASEYIIFSRACCNKSSILNDEFVDGGWWCWDWVNFGLEICDDFSENSGSADVVVATSEADTAVLRPDNNILDSRSTPKCLWLLLRDSNSLSNNLVRCESKVKSWEICWIEDGWSSRWCKFRPENFLLFTQKKTSSHGKNIFTVIPPVRWISLQDGFCHFLIPLIGQNF